MNIKHLPHVFTQEGVAMLSGVLRSPRAEQVNIAIMRAFVRLRETLSLHKELAHKLGELERKIENHDENIRTLFEAIHQLMTPPPAEPRREIGFHRPGVSREGEAQINHSHREKIVRRRPRKLKLELQLNLSAGRWQRWERRFPTRRPAFRRRDAVTALPAPARGRRGRDVRDA
jgi:hypothetical protein